MKYPIVIQKMSEHVHWLRDQDRNRPPYDSVRHWAYSFLLFLLTYESRGKKVHVEKVVKRLGEEYWWRRYIAMNNLAEEEYLVIWDQVHKIITPYIEQLKISQEETAA